MEKEESETESHKQCPMFSKEVSAIAQSFQQVLEMNKHVKEKDTGPTTFLRTNSTLMADLTIK